MAPNKPTKNRKGQAQLHGIQRGRPPKKTHGRTKGAKNKNAERSYTDEELQFAVNLDVEDKKSKRQPSLREGDRCVST